MQFMQSALNHANYTTKLLTAVGCQFDYRGPFGRECFEWGLKEANRLGLDP